MLWGIVKYYSPQYSFIITFAVVILTNYICNKKLEI